MGGSGGLREIAVAKWNRAGRLLTFSGARFGPEPCAHCARDRRAATHMPRHCSITMRFQPDLLRCATGTTRTHSFLFDNSQCGRYNAHQVNTYLFSSVQFRSRVHGVRSRSTLSLSEHCWRSGHPLGRHHLVFYSQEIVITLAMPVDPALLGSAGLLQSGRTLLRF